MVTACGSGFFKYHGDHIESHEHFISVVEDKTFIFIDFKKITSDKVCFHLIILDTFLVGFMSTE